MATLVVSPPRPSTRRVCHQVYIPPRDVAWTPPPEGYVKLNFDGGLFWDKTSAISVGIFRDHGGETVSSYALAIPEWTGRTPYDGEANALYFGLRFAFDHGLHRLLVEGDAKFLIEAVQGTRENTRYDEGVVEQIRGILDFFPERPRVTFIHREGNKAADALVKFVHDNQMSVWRGRELPVRVAEVADRERRGCVYVRKAKKYVTGPRHFH